MLIVRKLTIIIAIAIGLLIGMGAAVAYYAATGEDNDPVKRVTVTDS